MSAQPIAFHGAPAPAVPDTIKGIRSALPPELRPLFQDEIDEATDSGDLARIAQVKSLWWAKATWHSDPTLREDFAALERGELETFPSPFAKR